MMVAVGTVWFCEPSDQVTVTVTVFVLTSGLSFATVTCLVYVRPEAVTRAEGSDTKMVYVVTLTIAEQKAKTMTKSPHATIDAEPFTQRTASGLADAR